MEQHWNGDSMKLYIPHLGDNIKLIKDWTFRVFIEDRNRSMINLILDDHYDIPYVTYSNFVFNTEYERLPIYSKLVSLGKLEIKETKIPFEYNWVCGNKVASRYIDGYELSSKISEIYLDYTIPNESILTVDRIFIRKGSRDFDSVTFRWNKNRFWVKLDDANKIEFTL